ncbi:uncharacterized protein [Diadema setosum]|uniref:uncharacterized protein isoform X1 n=1 Tax=Diadema setosum TaxID=31175 RepID=UPI003B3A0869
MLTGTAQGNYSAKFQLLEQSRMKDVGVEHARQVAARERARKMSVETNRRRKALESKKKLEAQREAKRRQEVLDERRQRQRDATNRFQRLNKGSARKYGDYNNTAPAYPGAPLQEGILMARGYRLDSPRSSTYESGTPSLDDVLQMVGTPSSLSLKYGSGQPSYPSNGLAHSSTHPTPSHYTGSYLDTNANVSSDVAARNEVRTNGRAGQSAPSSVVNQGRVDSQASLIEQEIVEQQQQLLAQQQRTLQEFSQAIQIETGGEASDGEHLQRSGSLSSVDSLEEQKPDSSKQQNARFHNGKTSTGPAGQKGENEGTPVYERVGNTVEDQRANYSLYHNDVLMRGGSSNFNHNDALSSKMHQADDRSRMTSNGYHPEGPVRGVSDNDRAKNVSGYTYSQAGYNSSANHSYVTDSSKDNALNSTSQAWSVAKNTKPPIHQHSSAPTANTSQRQKPYSSQTTATAITVAPTVSYAGGGHVSQTQENVGHGGPQTHTNHYPGATKRPLQYQTRYNSEEALQDVTKHENSNLAEETIPQVMSPPKGILKKHKPDNSGKDRRVSGLAAAIMKDSLDMGKQNGVRSPKKGVRWTDLQYSDDGESVETQSTITSAAPAPRKPRLVSGVSARTVQERLGGGSETVVTGTPPRPKSGNVKERTSTQVKNNRFPRGSEAKQYPDEREEGNDKSAPVIQNGIRLDKTPTDEEINWLWDKVRTCLHTRDDGADASTVRQSLASQQHQDQRITANLRVAPPANKPRFSHYQDTLRRQTAVPRWRTNSDSGSHVQHAAHQRRPHVRGSSATRSNNQLVPESSPKGPARSGVTGHKPDVTESLLAFQQAEQMVQQNAEEADIAAVLHQQHQPRQQQQYAQIEQKVNPSALSIEEAKIMESLDRLNARLKTVTAEMNGSFTPLYPVMQPRPPVYGGGFRGHRPVSSRPGVTGVTKSSHRARAHSADRSNVRMGQHR